MLRLMTPPLALWLDVRRRTHQMSHLWRLAFSRCVLEYQFSSWSGHTSVTWKSLAGLPFLPGWLGEPADCRCSTKLEGPRMVVSLHLDQAHPKSKLGFWRDIPPLLSFFCSTSTNKAPISTVQKPGGRFDVHEPNPC